MYVKKKKKKNQHFSASKLSCPLQYALRLLLAHTAVILPILPVLGKRQCKLKLSFKKSQKHIGEADDHTLGFIRMVQQFYLAIFIFASYNFKNFTHYFTQYEHKNMVADYRCQKPLMPQTPPFSNILSGSKTGIHFYFSPIHKNTA